MPIFLLSSSTVLGKLEFSCTSVLGARTRSDEELIFLLITSYCCYNP